MQEQPALRGAARQIGIGLRQPHLAALLDSRPSLDFIEVHSENYFGDGGAALAGLHATRAHYPVSLHGVGLALGSAAGLDPWHLDRLARLVARVDPVRVSDHACFARVALADGSVVHGADLLPIAFNQATLGLMVGHVGEVQERLRRPILVENLAAYLVFDDVSSEGESMSEPVFLTRLCRQSGCGLLLDVNNLMVNALNAAEHSAAEPALAACRDFIDALPVGIVGEVHLAGYRDTGPLVIDDHGSRVRPGVWALYEHALRRFGSVPALIEWDTDLPALEVLLDESDRAARLQARIAGSA